MEQVRLGSIINLRACLLSYIIKYVKLKKFQLYIIHIEELIAFFFLTFRNNIKTLVTEYVLVLCY